MMEPKKLSPMPPVPASQPNPVGIDGVFEGLCPPYVKSMDEAVDRVVEAKYGPRGNYGDQNVFSLPYRNPKNAEEYVREGTKYTPDCIAYAKDICNYIWDTYGRFPAHVDTFYSCGMWLQFSHLEIEYYDQFFDSRLYERQAKHDEMWHSHAEAPVVNTRS
jgi:hypothetical protein